MTLRNSFNQDLKEMEKENETEPSSLTNISQFLIKSKEKQLKLESRVLIYLSLICSLRGNRKPKKITKNVSRISSQKSTPPPNPVTFKEW